MVSSNLENNLKNSFSKVKEHISHLESEIQSIKNLINQQNLLIQQISARIEDFKHFNQDSTRNPAKTPILESSTGKNGVNQSINQQAINQSTSNQALKHTSETPNNTFLDQSSTIRQDNQSITNQSPVNQSPITKKKEENSDFKLSKGIISENFFKKITKQEAIQEQKLETIKSFKTNINDIFRNISKQELRVFLTIYQLEDDKIEATYATVSQQIKLSESCIRGYISTIIKKGLPLSKQKLNNQKTVFFIIPEFKSLGLKSKLITRFYGFEDPYQKTLFES